MDFDINQALDAQAFLNRVAALPKEPGVSLDQVVAPSIEQEAELRCLFAQDRKNDRLSNPYVGLISVFEAPEETGIRSTRARVVKDGSEQDLTAKYVFPLSQNKRRKDLEPCVVGNLEDFQRNWTIFTEGSLAQLTDWNNVIAAGGSVLGCLLPLQPSQKESRRTIRKFYHSTAYPTSDIDLFLWGLTPEQAEVKINLIYEAVRDSVPWDVTCVRSKHTISIHSQYPYRSVQIVLRLYHSPAEILAGFDVDAPCVAYDGSRILANPRSIVALMRQANTVDMTRRSPSYEVRLAKYASRGFEIYVPNLRRSDIDPTIFERSLNRITGLARLLVLEKLAKPEARISYLESRRNLRSRVNNTTIYTRRMRHRRKGDLKGEEEIAGLDMNDYDVASLHIPYGPGWTAKRIEKLVYQTDLGMNSTFNPKNKNRRLHRHVGFFGIMKECIEDLCEFCPEPQNNEEKALQKEEDKQYIRGRISFIEDDPGRQSMTGSFNPIDIGEWSELAYLGPTERFFTAITTEDRNTVLQLLASGEVDVNRRDLVGRTALQVAALCAAGEICMDLIDAGARMTARLADGRSALHVAAQMDLPVVVEKMLVQSTQNEEKAKEEEAKAKAAAEKGEESLDVGDGEAGEESDYERPSSEDDWSSEEDDKSKNKKGEKDEVDKNVPDADADVLEDKAEQPDVLDVNLTDWDLAFTPLDYAVVSGSKDVIQALLNAGVDPKLTTKAKDHAARVLHPLFLTTYISDDALAEEIIDQLLRAGASSAQADGNLLSIFHSFVLSGRTRLVEKILRSDPSANAVLNVPLAMSRDHIVYPLVSAIDKRYYSTAALLLGYGAKVSLSAEDVQKVNNMIPNTTNTWYRPPKTPHELDYLKTIHLPMETALACQNYMVEFLLKLGAQISVPIKAYFERGQYYEEARRSIVECVDKQISMLNEALTKTKKDRDIGKLEFAEHPKTFAEMRKTIAAKLNQVVKDNSKDDSPTWTKDKLKEERKKAEGLRQALVFFQEVKGIFEKTDAKTYAQIFANHPDAPKPLIPKTQVSPKIEAVPKGRTQYRLIKERWGRENVLLQQLDQYDALFEACWMGDNASIEELCLPGKKGRSSKPPIQIAVVTEYDPDECPHTPFSVAILARKWDTARVVLAIATAQYKPKEDENKQLTTRSFIIDEDSDSDSDDDTVSGCSTDMDVDATGVGTITDLAKGDSSVQCDTSPKMLVNERVSGRIGPDGQSIIHSESVIRQACYAGDLEAFVNIADMMQRLPEPEEPDMECLVCAIYGDSPEIVDEIIRRTGHGIDLTQLVAPETDAQPLTNTSKLYLGLTVHGKKRKDLARYLEGHRDDGSNRNRLPMLWQAIENGAKKVIEYLSGSAPQAAYRYYATTKSTEQAEALRNLQNVDKQLPKLLGIVPNGRGENALMAVILIAPVKEKLPLAKKILALFPGQNYLQSTLAFTGWTVLHLAIAENLEPAFFDYLLSNGISAEQADKRGMNIYHLACHLGHVDLVNYLLKKLPEDINSYLLVQTTRLSGETPLMSAVGNGQRAIVDKLLSSGLGAMRDSLTMRDSKGSMALHTAARLGFANIASSLVGQSTAAEAIYSENGVGETPLETASAKWLINATRGGSTMPRHIGVASMEISSPMTISEPLDGHKLAQEVDLLKTVQANLLRDGKLSANEKLKDALDGFIPYLSEKAAAAARVTPESGGGTRDECDYEKTFKVVSAAASRASGHRRLVHLIDVQRSVQTSLKMAVRKSTHEDDRRRREYLKSEEIPDEVGAEVREKLDMWNGILGRSSRLRNWVYWGYNDVDD